MDEIGLNGLLLDSPYSGTAVYTRALASLLPTVAPDLSFRLFLRHASAPGGIRTDRISTPLSRVPGTIGAQLDKLAWEEAALPLAASMRRQSLIHSLYFAAPMLSPCPVIVTVHDLIPLAVPGYHRSRQSALYSSLMAWSTRRASAIITVSKHSKRDVVRLLRVPEDRVYVTYEAVDQRFHPGSDRQEVEALRARYALPERYVLYLGSAEKRKGLETLVLAWSRVARAMRDRQVRLVIVANFPPPDRLYPDVPGLVSDLGLDGDIVFVPRVDEADKPAVYRAALLFVFPSTYEGFGIPPLEAMASGLPVVASNATSLPEVVGSAGVLLPPGDIDAWAQTMLRVVDSDSERGTLGAAGVRRAGAFSWRRTAQETVRVYREVLDCER